MGKIMLNGVDYSAAVASQTLEGATDANTTRLGVSSVSNGARSTALGQYANATGQGATALGYYAMAVNHHTTAVGYYANAKAYGSIALGYSTNAVGNNSVALGTGAKATAVYTTAVGYYANASGECCTALGCNTNAIANYSTAVGYYANASGTYSIALGTSANASGDNSIALGHYANAAGNNSTALGRFAVTSNTNSIQLGNASFLSSITSKVAITVTSDARDKADITEMEDGALAFLSKVTPIRYVFNGRELYIDEDNLSDEERSKKEKFGLCAYDRTEHGKGTKKGSRIRVGVSAQNVQQALEAIYGNDSYANLVNNNLFDFDLDEIPRGVESRLAVNYEGFIPFLIKAVQELAAKVEQLQGKEDA